MWFDCDVQDVCFCDWQTNGSSDDERYSRFWEECQGPTVMVENPCPWEANHQGRPVTGSLQARVRLVGNWTRSLWPRGATRSIECNKIETGLGIVHTLAGTTVVVGRGVQESEPGREEKWLKATLVGVIRIFLRGHFSLILVPHVVGGSSGGERIGFRMIIRGLLSRDQ